MAKTAYGAGTKRRTPHRRHRRRSHRLQKQRGGTKGHAGGKTTRAGEPKGTSLEDGPPRRAKSSVGPL